MNQLIERVGKIAGVHPNNVEPIYHLYVPATLPSNLHLDNFNKYLRMVRYGNHEVLVFVLEKP
jgi:hypothetical protein